jgi:hypothetical protein
MLSQNVGSEAEIRPADRQAPLSEEDAAPLLGTYVFGLGAN